MRIFYNLCRHVGAARFRTGAALEPFKFSTPSPRKKKWSIYEVPINLFHYNQIRSVVIRIFRIKNRKEIIKISNKETIFSIKT